MKFTPSGGVALSWAVTISTNSWAGGVVFWEKVL
jgi:hypothetical protein